MSGLNYGAAVLRHWILAMIAVAAAGSAAAATDQRCVGAAENALLAAGIAASEIAETNLVDVEEGGRSGTRTVGYEAWTTLTSCRGSIVAKLDLRCRVRETYARGQCKSKLR